MSAHMQADAVATQAGTTIATDVNTPREQAHSDAATRSGEAGTAAVAELPHTTWRWLTAPEFGAAGSGGAEYEPGPRNA